MLSRYKVIFKNEFHELLIQRRTQTRALSTPAPSPQSLVQRIYQSYHDVSGAAEIEMLKRAVHEKSLAFDQATAAVAQARLQYDSLLQRDTHVHQIHAQHLRRRDHWTESDVAEFADIVKQEIKVKQEMQQAKDNMTASEVHLAKTQLDYIDAMRKRYHEEQIWQDKWRILSTYGTWALIVLNTVVFMATQLFHYQREAKRIQAIENLIVEKLPTANAHYSGSESEGASQNAEDENGAYENNGGDVEPQSTQQQAVDKERKAGEVTEEEEEEEASREREGVVRRSTWKEIGATYISLDGWRERSDHFRQNFHIPSAVTGVVVTVVMGAIATAFSRRTKG